MDHRVRGDGGVQWSEWFAGVMDIVDTQVWEMEKGDRECVDFDWTSARVANDVVDLPNPDVPNDY
eukprot:375007-Karenia_brevis.AAC.1